ncbi:unnamed protein product [Enterobius vermicularis]|uniref:G_PROTEIN_RECEP_F1_2 domain-containing protein n=1 Tax=Enterobius vermicularis TaxID=51028 RepID=A0A0N4VPC4_ENTVE|nr:unnamed protein product [Enterobius vermicularis]
MVAVGDTIDATYFLFGSLGRLVDIATDTFYYPISLKGCLLKFYVLPRVFGSEMVAMMMLVLSVEKVVAVFLPLFYRAYSDRLRLSMIAAALIYCIVSSIVMIVTSVLDKRPVVGKNRYCGISTSVTRPFALYHQFGIITVNIVALILCFTAFMVVWNRTKRFRNAAKELQNIKPILVVSAVSTLILIANNVAYVLTNFTSISVSQNLQNVVVTYTSAVFSLSKVFLYLLTGKEFRTALRQRWRPTLTNVVNPC